MARGTWVLAACALAACAAGVAGGPGPGPAAAGDDRVPIPAGAGDDLRRTAVVRAVEAVSPAVVNIATDRVVDVAPRGFMRFREWEEMFPGRWRRKVQGLGTGVVIDPAGYVLTNSHVVSQGTAIHVTFRPPDGVVDPKDEGLLAEVVANDPRNDLALLKIKGEGPFPTVEFGSSHDLLIGEPVIAIGNPFGFSSTVTAGVVSATNRTLNLETGAIDGVVQTDATIDPGNSGGPLLNIHGRLIGLNTAVFREARSIGFAIPVDRVKAVLSSLADPIKGNQVWTGFEVHNRGSAVLVDRVEAGGPAAKAGLRAGDEILDADGVEPTSVLSLKAELVKKAVGQRLRLRVRRPGAREPVAVDIAVAEHPGIGLLRSRIGIEVDPWKIDPGNGVSLLRFRVRQVRKGSPAEQIEILPNDVIFTLAGVPLGSSDDAVDALRTIGPDPVTKVGVLRFTGSGPKYAEADLKLD
ncbi:MAG TPA: trypsin-like peptidase domain-containing protein [Planctomycetota bacterium]|nr:trypsin-like peptidase domain-containing protein [Planctomycetota bacterium]